MRSPSGSDRHRRIAINVWRQRLLGQVAESDERFAEPLASVFDEARAMPCGLERVCGARLRRGAPVDLQERLLYAEREAARCGRMVGELATDRCGKVLGRSDASGLAAVEAALLGQVLPFFATGVGWGLWAGKSAEFGPAAGFGDRSSA